jgi:hypothetical protein
VDDDSGSDHDVDDWFNPCEAALWLVLGIIVLVRRSPRIAWWKLNLPLGLALLAFSASDVIETFTGAWWTPWWLLAMKAACVGVFLACAIAWRRMRRPVT